MVTLTTEPGEVAVVAKLVETSGRYLISVAGEYSQDLRAIKSRRVLVKVSLLV